MLKIWVNF